MSSAAWLSIFHDVIDQVEFQFGQGAPWWFGWGSAIGHGKPENPPTDRAEDCDQIREALRCSQLGIFRFTTRFEDFLKNLDLPPKSAPLQFLDRIAPGPHCDIRNQALSS